MSSLPPEVAGMGTFALPQRLALAILREKMPTAAIYTRIPKDIAGPFLLVRQLDGLGFWDGDPRFLNKAIIKIDTFTQGLNGETDGGVFQDAIRTKLFEAWREQKVYPELHSSLNRLICVSDPNPVTDWATSTGPVQFADLPGLWFRWESRYEFQIRNWPS